MSADPRAALEAALADRYAIYRELGRGGMATVYLARDVRHKRPEASRVRVAPGVCHRYRHRPRDRNVTGDANAPAI